MDPLKHSSDVRPLRKSVPVRPWYAWRISLRTLMIVTTGLSVLFGLIVAPVSWELTRAAKVSRQTAELQAGGAYVVHRGRPENFAVKFAHILSLGHFSYIGKEIIKVDCGDGNWDLAKMPVIDTLEEIHFRHRGVACSDPNYRQPSVRLVHYENSGSANPATQNFKPRLLQHFPNVEKARLFYLLSDAPILQDLVACKRLKRLELSLQAGGNKNGSEMEPTPWHGKPVSDLKQLEVLHADCMWMPVDWSFLATMPELREIRATGCHVVWSDTKANKPRTRDEARRRTPLFYAAQLPKLNWLNMRYAESYSEDLTALAKNTQIRKLKLDALPDGPTSLAGLHEAKKLQFLHLEFKHFKAQSDLPQLAEELQELQQLRELSCSFAPLTREHIDLLLQLKQIEAFQMIRIDGYALREEDLGKLLTVRVDSFPNNSQLRSGRKLHERAKGLNSRP